MSDLTTSKPGPFDRVPADLCGKLQWLCRFGQPSVRMMDSGWYASIDMNTNTTGTAFKVRSEFALPSPTAAAEQLIERMLTALATLSNPSTDRK